MGKGAAIGGVAGAAIGTGILPGVGTSVGGALGSGIGGLIESFSSDSNVGDIPMEDPEQRMMLEQLKRKAQSYNTGSAATAALDQAGQGLVQTQDALTKVTGGDVGATIAALNKANKVHGGNINNIYAQTEANGRFFTTAAQDMLSKIAQRKLDITTTEGDRNRAEGAQSAQDAGGNLLAGVAKGGLEGFDINSLLDMIKKKKGLNTANSFDSPGEIAPARGSEVMNDNVSLG